MSNTIIWASEAAESEKQAPPVEKQKTGWQQETPPHQWFNWHMNRTDQRLSKLEKPNISTVYESLAGTRAGIVKAGEKFLLPAKYIVGGDNLRVYLDGVRCYDGEDKQYVEAGAVGVESDYIRWNDDIGPEYDIHIEIPVKATENVAILDSAVTLDELTQRIAQVLAEKSLNLAISQRREDSLYGTRAAEIGVGDSYGVPEYAVGEGGLSVYLDGQLCSPGLEYDEIGEQGVASGSIKWKRSVATDVTITAISRAVSTPRMESLTGTRASEIAVGESFNVPQYTVGSRQLSIYLDGQLCVAGLEYAEQGKPGDVSAAITWNVPVPTDATITAWTSGMIVSV